MSNAAVLEVQDLRVRLGVSGRAISIVDAVSFHVDAGETLAIVGESGSGKTVTALALMRLLVSHAEISAAKLTFDGLDLSAATEAQMRELRGNRLAMIFQDPLTAMNPAMTVGKQVAEPIHEHLALGWRHALARAKALCAEAQIPDAEHRLTQYPHQFSGGMRQRAMIATALGCRPKLIIADEPTTALDVTVQSQVLYLLKELVRKAGSSLILITHDLGLVARHADRVCIMYAGRIVETGTIRQVFRNPAHPYTRGLLASIPRLDRPVADRLVPIRGQPPLPGRWPAGCSFHPRCGFAIDHCKWTRPSLELVEEEHWRACLVGLPRYS